MSSDMPYLQISGISVALPSTSKKCVQSVDVRIDGEQVVARWEYNENAHEAALVLDPPRSSSSSIQLIVHLSYRLVLVDRWKSQEVFISVQDLLAVEWDEQNDRTEWKREYGKMQITIRSIRGVFQLNQVANSNIELPNDGDNQQLLPTTLDILQTCPSFRILVMGKTGVGKSKLINRTFGVTDAVVSRRDTGYADINKEIPSKTNARFLLHDSKGFEPGDDTNVRIIQKFINDRNNMPLVKDKLHAIWLCIDIPTAGGRLLERGVEDFLRLKLRGEIGNVPVIVVFTKYDLLVLREDRLLQPSTRERLSEEDIPERITENAQASLQKICIGPLEKLVGNKVPYTTVSTEPGHEKRLSDLVQITYDKVSHYVVDASIVSAMAQRVSPSVNIQASIAVGRRKYWKRLAQSVHFSGRTLQECLEVIHTDITAVWHFDDPDGHLSSIPFKALMTNIVTSDLSRRTAPNTNRTITAGISMVAGVAGIVSTLAGPAAPIVIPVFAAFVLARWVTDVYRQTNTILKRLMIYIVDLTLILQDIFWLQALANKRYPVSRRLIKVAVRAYGESNTRHSVHFKIDNYVKEQMHRLNIGPDSTLRMIETLLDCYTLDCEEMVRLRGNIASFDFSRPDERWDPHVENQQGIHM